LNAVLGATIIERSTTLTCRVMTDPADLVRLRAAWTALLETSYSNEPTLSPRWLLTWWRVFGASQGRRLRVVCFEEDGRLIGLAPLLCRLHWHRRTVPLRRLQPLGAGERPADAICSDYLNIIAERGAEDRVATRLARALARGELGPWDELVLPLMDGTGRMPGLVLDACRAKGLLAELSQTTSAPYIPLPSTWSEYLQALSKKRRHHVRAALRDFDDWAGSDQRLEHVTDQSDLRQGQLILIALHKQRWRNAPEGGGVFRSPRFIAFHEAVLPQLLEANALQLLWLHARGRPVAAMYSVVWDNKVHFYQAGRDTTLPGQLRPGVVLIAKAIQQAIEAGRREFDFLGGTALYKSQLALAARPLVELRVARPGVRETARRLVETAAAYCRRWRRPTPATATSADFS
jgi:CelD/BcsL family acetyltransferase involved in cellulose biosynthesis